MNMQEIFGENIFTYSRADAIADGVLIDVSETAREAGIKFPVAVTEAVWRGYVEVPSGVQCQDEVGRLWDILWMLRYAISKGANTNLLNFALHVRNHNRDSLTQHDLIDMKAVCGPGDDAAPVITIMLPEED